MRSTVERHLFATAGAFRVVIAVCALDYDKGRICCGCGTLTRESIKIDRYNSGD